LQQDARGGCADHVEANGDRFVTATDGTLAHTQHQRPPFYRNTTVIKWVLQIVTLVFVLATMFFFVNEAGDNLEARGVKFDFDFININQGFDIGEGIDKNPATGGRALFVGMVNTLRLAILGIILATILGVIVGISRLSNNWIVNRVASVFVETLRNIPLLVQIFIWVAVFQTLGPLRAPEVVVDQGAVTATIGGERGDPMVIEDDGTVVKTIDSWAVTLAEPDDNGVVEGVGQFVGEGEDAVFQVLDDSGATLIELSDQALNGPYPVWFSSSAKGLAMPRIFITEGFYQWAVFLLLGAILARFVYKNRVAERDKTGKDTEPTLVAFGAFALVAVIGWFINPVFGFLGGFFQAISDVWAEIPQLALQLFFAGLSIFFAARWIKKFRDSFRTPAGLGKMTDDDWFRQIFAAFAGLFGAAFFLWLWPGFSSWVINSGSDFWGVAADKFGTDGFGVERGSTPIDAAKQTITGSNVKRYGLTGATMTIGFASVLAALTLYTAAYIAEIVRGGILAVPKGQSEAADAIGLSRIQSLRFIILPQAFRVSLPPLGNQYLNLTKNTTLAIAALYADLYNVGNTVINQSGRALPVFIIWMLFYLACSLTISVIVNFFNVRLAIVER